MGPDKVHGLVAVALQVHVDVVDLHLVMKIAAKVAAKEYVAMWAAID